MTRIEYIFLIRMIYEDVSDCFVEKGCVLLTTKEEFDTLRGRHRHPKFRYVAQCNHENVVHYNVFKSRGTGLLCPKCVSVKNSKVAKDNMSKDVLQHLKLEKTCIDYFIDLVGERIACEKAFDGCKADVLVKPKYVTSDDWVGIQVKTTMCKRKTYGFHITCKRYDGLLILCICNEDKKMWLLPFDVVDGISKLTIGSSKSKYSQYEVDSTNINDVLLRYYEMTTKFTFDHLNTPTCIYQQREKLYRELRDAKVSCLSFCYTNMEGEVFDFLCNGKRVQEKVGGYYKKGYLFHLYKNNGKKNNKRNHTGYAIGDNSFYWLNCQDMRTFYVIPEIVLIDNKCVGTSKKETLYINPSHNDKWYSKFKFDYDNLNEEKLNEMFN